MALPAATQDPGEERGWDDLQSKTQTELDQTQRDLKELTLMLEQSQVEVDKLASRNASITMHLQQVKEKIETIPTAEVRAAYDAALDAQQRLVVMRSQVEKLNSEKNHLHRYLELLEIVQNVSSSGHVTSNGGESFATAEMIIQAQEAERLRLSRQMHDGPAQALSNFILLTEIAIRLFDVDQDKARGELSNLKAAASSTFQKVRDFISDLRPMMLDDLGMVPTARRYIDAFRDKSKMDVSVTVTGQERRLESYLEVMIFRSIQELIHNIGQHSQANQVKVQIDMAPQEVRVTVEDNGRGFDVEAAMQESGLGIKLIKERAEMLGGHFDISSEIGEGTKITFDVPATEVKTIESPIL